MFCRARSGRVGVPLLTLALLSSAGCANRGGATAAATTAGPGANPAAAAAAPDSADNEKVIRDIQNNPTLSESAKRMYIDALRKSGPGNGAGGTPTP